MSVVLDTHTLVFWSVTPERLSKTAMRAIARAELLAVSDMTWFEIAWLVRGGRLPASSSSLASWLEDLAKSVATIAITPAIAETAASFPSTFPRDPADRIITATAVDRGWKLISKDERLREHPASKRIVIW